MRLRSVPSRALFVSLSLWVSVGLGCGGARISSSLADGGPSPTADANPPGCPGAVPTLDCIACDGSSAPLECVDGNWRCPSESCPDPTPFPPSPPPVDAGADACSSAAPIACASPVGCIGSYVPTCSGGQWRCVSDGEVCDASVPVEPPDANLPPPFSCGQGACDPQTSYCQIMTGGVSPDAGSFACAPLPPTCSGVAASCACVQAGQELSPIPCDCIAQGSDVVITCVAP